MNVWPDELYGAECRLEAPQGDETVLTGVAVPDNADHALWCPCFLAWQPVTADAATCPAYGCTPDLLIVRPVGVGTAETGEKP